MDSMSSPHPNATRYDQSDDRDVVVIGGGVVGLAVARAFAHREQRVLVLEAQSTFGLGTSGRNSEVIHAGIYYPPSSLKARLCVRGKRLLYEYLEANASRIPYRKCGKLLVACSSAELGVLEALYENARKNGVELTKVTPEEVADVRGEHNVRCVAGLWSPSSGILDVQEYMRSLVRDIEDLGGEIRYNARVIGGSLNGAAHVDGTVVHTARTGRALHHALLVEDTVTKITRTIRARCVVNAAGLYARPVSLSLGIDPRDAPRIRFAKGNYFEPASESSFAKLSKNQLVYPIPVEGGLGIHATIDVRGGLRFGPDVEFLTNIDTDTVNSIDSVDYSVDKGRQKSFQEAIRKYYIDGDDVRLRPAYAGLRPKAVDHNNKAINDFVITIHRPRFIALYGIESPGLTASLAIAEEVVGMTGLWRNLASS